MRSNKAFLVFFNLFLTVCLCSCSVKTNNVSSTSNKIKNYKIIVSSIDTAISDEDKNLIKNQAEIALKNVPNYLGIKKLDENVSGEDIYIIVSSDTDVSYYTNSSAYIYISKKSLDTKKPPVVHEMTHLLTYNDPSGNIEYNFVSEGIAQLMQGLYGINGTFMLCNDMQKSKEEFSKGLNEIKNNNEYISISELIQSNNYYTEYTDKKAKKKRSIAYGESTSFFLFLNDKYGKEKIRQIYHSEKGTDFDKVCRNVFKKSLNEMEKEWRNYYNF